MMNSTVADLTPEQRLQVLQIWWQAQAAQNQHLFPPANPGANLPPNNMAFQAFHPGLMSSQAQPATLQAMMQMQVLQQQQQQQQSPFGLAGISQSAGPQFPSGIPPVNINSGAFQVPSGFPELQTPRPIFSSADEDTFARALHDNESLNFGEILNLLNGKNGITTLQWLNIWLGNSVKILNKVKILESMPSRSKTSSSSSSHRTRPSNKSAQQPLDGGTHLPSRSSRKLHNSRPASRYQTRSPTPPDTIVMTPQGYHKYTRQDVAYFKNFLAHTLKHDPSAMDTPSLFSTQLAARVPHHTALSWRSWIRDHPDIIESVKRHVLRGESLTSDSDSRTSSVNDDKNEDDSEDEDEDKGEGEDSESSSSVDECDVSLSSSESESEVHAQSMQMMKSIGARPRYLPSERRGLAKYIATVTLTEWDNEQDWDSFQRMYTRHSAKSWRKWYYRHEKDVRRMARRFEIRNAKRKQEAGRTIIVTNKSHRPTQNPNRPKPSSSRSRDFFGSNHSVLEKRRRTDGGEYYDPGPSKRPRTF